MHIPILNDILIIFLLSIIVIVIFNKLKIPAIVGYLITGIIAGPYSLKLISSIHEVELLAEIGVILFLFTIGMEFSLSKLLKMKKMILIGGSFQVLVTILISYLLSIAFGFSNKVSIVIGFLTALSSTAIVLKLIQNKGLMGSPQGNLGLSILIYQDISILPMFLILPLLAGSADNVGLEIFYMFLKIIGIVVFLILSVKFFIPFVMDIITRTRIKELFYITVLFICFGIVWIASAIGISPALGAFLAGLIISETEYNYEAISIAEPFKDVFTGFFFVSIGMLLNLGFLSENIILVLILTSTILIIKFITASSAVLILKYPMRTAIFVGFFLAQIGEFSLVLSKYSFELGLIENDLYQNFLAVAIFSMAITPFIAELGNKLSQKIKSKSINKKNKEIKSDLVIIGFGLNGSNISKAAKFIGLNYSIIEMNPDTVKKIKDIEPIIYGDASKESVLHHSGILNAKTCVIVISDPSATNKIAKTVKNLNPGIHLIVRTRYVSEMKQLYELGVDDVIPEEFETSIEITARILNKFLVPKDKINEFIYMMRSNHYKMFRNFDGKKSTMIEFIDIETDFANLVIKDNSVYLNKKLNEIKIRQEKNLSIIAIKRERNWIINPDANETLKLNDNIIIFGEIARVNEFCDNLKNNNAGS